MSTLDELRALMDTLPKPAEVAVAIEFREDDLERLLDTYQPGSGSWPPPLVGLDLLVAEQPPGQFTVVYADGHKEARPLR